MECRIEAVISMCTFTACMYLCGCNPQNQASQEYSFQPTAAPDTIAVDCVFEIPDSVRFYEVACISVDDLGNTYVLDGIGCCIHKFNPEHNYLYSISQRGNGPGEISSPTGFTVLNNNRLIVIDNGTMKCEAFTTDGEYLGDILEWTMFVPNDICAIEDSSFIGSVFSFRSSDDGMVITCDICRYRDSEEPEVLYYTRDWNWSPENSHEIYEEYRRVLYAGDISGMFYLVPDTREYRVQIYGLDSSLNGVLTRSDLTRVAKQDSIIVLEKELFEHYAAQDQAYTGGYEPDPFYPLIRSIGVDSLGRLWVGRGDMHPEAVFDVWKPDGESVKSVYVSAAMMPVIDEYIVDKGSIIGYHQSVEGDISFYSVRQE